jgi:hypothetical protein
MTIVQEVTDAIDLITRNINNIRTLVEACQDGGKFLMTHHPGVRDDLGAMCHEMQKTLHAIAAASAIVTHFRFTVATDAMHAEPARFNDYLMEHKSQALEVRDQLETMRGHCHVIREHAASMEKTADSFSLRSLFSLIGVDSRERQDELRAALEEIYNDEMAYHATMSAMSDAVHRALEAVQDALGPSGAMDPVNVPIAAEVLGAHADAFAGLESTCNYEARRIQRVLDDLRGV